MNGRERISLTHISQISGGSGEGGGGCGESIPAYLVIFVMTVSFEAEIVPP